MREPTPFEYGVRYGHDAALKGSQEIPPNPYRLRTDDRKEWSLGCSAGKQLGRKHRDELMAVLADQEGARKRILDGVVDNLLGRPRTPPEG